MNTADKKVAELNTSAKSLIAGGWKRSGNGIRCWYRPQLPAAFHTLQHALDIQKSLKRGER